MPWATLRNFDGKRGVASEPTLAFDAKRRRHIPDGHLNFTHLWPVQLPPVQATVERGLSLGKVGSRKAVGGFLEAVALAPEREQHATVWKAVEEGHGKSRVAEEVVPLVDDAIRRDHSAAASL